MVEPVIRVAHSDDLPGVLELYRHLHADDPVLDACVAKAAWLALLSSGLTIPFVADVAGVLVSSCTLAVIPNMSRGARPYGMIENVVTRVGHRRNGFARATLHAAIERAWSVGCYKVLLATGSKQELILRFYEAVGFHRGGKTYFEVRGP